ncbi:DUF6361 family protein [Planctellipticum variicoloris]|uniref:DUF6361 family protein n=1 Tax=Planctellipticum variicoloris TaxID=3064265 RepID=UPI003013A5A3|nr:DUF6361 family protein [Planctomycetaceae bacterium SH412]
MLNGNGRSSSIGWIDFSSEHREKVRTVLDLLGVPSVLDELGIGAIRDSFSDTLFPGILTIQTRAKYFLTIPRILRDYERLPLKTRHRSSLAEYLKERENQVMGALERNHRTRPERGIIGVDFVGKKGEVQRKPSSVYWNGLRTFGLVTTSLSLKEFMRIFANPDSALHDLIGSSDETKGDDPDAVDVGGPVVHTAAYAEGWEESLTLHLSFDEANFLARQIETRVPESLLGQILMDDEIRNTFVELPDDWRFAEFCEGTPFLGRLTDELRRVLWAANDFWQLLKGAHIRYNVALQARHGTEERRAEFEQRWEAWRSEMHGFSWDRWETDFLWQLAKRHRRQIKPFTRLFVANWIAAVRSGTEAVSGLDRLVATQERLNKGARARLKDNSSERVPKWIGIDALDYRYSQARTIIMDIDDGLTRTERVDA